MDTPFLNRYRNGEFLQYFKDLLQLLEEQDLNALQLTKQQEALQQLVITIDMLFKQSQGSIITQELVHLDKQRDKALTGLRYVITGYQQHFDTTIAKAATALFTNIAKHGEQIQRLSYQEETAVLDSLINDWENEIELSEALLKLKLNDWLIHLKTMNTKFSTRYLDRVEEQASHPNENISELRAAASAIYKELIAHIHAHITLGTTGTYSILQEQINILTKQYNQVVDNRSSGNTNQIDTKLPNTEITEQ